MGNYCELQDVRDEGFTVAQFSDARVNASIVLATTYINEMCGQWFEAREFADSAPLELCGDDSKILQVPIPIISVSRVRVLNRALGSSSYVDLDADSYYVYNRHMDGMTSGAADDRDNPRITAIAAETPQRRYLEWDTTGPRFPRGSGNVQLSGWFGYTDPSDEYGYEATGVTPPLIVHACLLLVVRELELLRRQSRRATWRNRNRIIEAWTKDQKYTLAKLLQGGFLTGDQEIDSILARYTRGYGRVGSA